MLSSLGRRCARRLAAVPMLALRPRLLYASTRGGVRAYSNAENASPFGIEIFMPDQEPSAEPLTEAEIERQDINSMQPEEIVRELERFIVGQAEAKKAVAIAMRNRWRRKQVPDPLRKEIIPKNILMIGPTGVGKTEVARRMAKLADAPFIKVEATKYTEVGYRGADVDSIIKDLVEVAINHVRERDLKKMEKIVSEKVEDSILDMLLGKSPPEGAPERELALRHEIRLSLRAKELDEITLEYEPKQPPPPTPKNPTKNMPGQINLLHLPPNVINLSQFVSKDQGRKKGMRKMTIRDIRPLEEQAVRATLLRNDVIVARAVREVEELGIVFIDEIDKIVGSAHRNSADASDEGVQRDLLPIIEGTKISTDYGDVDTSKILFICAGAFHQAKPSDLLAELQGRLPIRVQLQALTADDLYRIMTEPEPNLIRQQVALMKTEEVDLFFEDDAIRKIAKIASDVNEQVESIGARRLFTVIEKIMEDLNFNASKYRGERVVIDASKVEDSLKDLVKRTDLQQYIL